MSKVYFSFGNRIKEALSITIEEEINVELLKIEEFKINSWVIIYKLSDDHYQIDILNKISIEMTRKIHDVVMAIVKKLSIV